MVGEQRNIGAELCERLACIGTSLTLTVEEREAIEWAAYAAEKWYEHTAAATLRGLLDLTKDGGK